VRRLLLDPILAQAAMAAGAGPFPAVAVEMLRRAHVRGRLDRFMDLLNHRSQSSDLVTPTGALRTTARLLASHGADRRRILSEALTLASEDAHRRWLNNILPTPPSTSEPLSARQWPAVALRELQHSRPAASRVTLSHESDRARTASRRAGESSRPANSSERAMELGDAAANFRVQKPVLSSRLARKHSAVGDSSSTSTGTARVFASWVSGRTLDVAAARTRIEGLSVCFDQGVARSVAPRCDPSPSPGIAVGVGEPQPRVRRFTGRDQSSRVRNGADTS
jgi:hypothetical protein